MIFTEIQEFNTDSGSVILSDPCYIRNADTKIWCNVVIDNVQQGTYVSFVEKGEYGDWGPRVKALYCCHKNYFISPELLKNVIIKSNIHFLDLGVDSGQFGIFDSSLLGSFGEEDYDKVIYLTWYAENSFGTTDNYSVSSSGFGDGGYSAKALKNTKGKYIAFRVEFIGDEEQESPYVPEEPPQSPEDLLQQFLSGSLDVTLEEVEQHPLQNGENVV